MRKQGIDLPGFSLKRRFYRIVPPLVFMVLIVMPLPLWSNVTMCWYWDQIAAVFGLHHSLRWQRVVVTSNFIPHLFLHTWSLGPRSALLCALGHFFGVVLSQVAKTAGQYQVCSFSHPAGSSLYLLVHVHPRLLTANFSTIYFWVSLTSSLCGIVSSNGDRDC